MNFLLAFLLYVVVMLACMAVLGGMVVLAVHVGDEWGYGAGAGVFVVPLLVLGGLCFAAQVTQ